MSSNRLAGFCALMAFATLGYALWAISALIPFHSDLRLAAQIMATDIQPKPRVQFVYMALVLATPFVVMPLGRLFKQDVDGSLLARLFPTLVILAVFAFILVHDPLAGVAHARWPAVALAAVVGLLIARYEPRFEKQARLAAQAFLAVFTIAVTYSWRTFDVVSALAVFDQVNLGAALYSVVQAAHGKTCTVDYVPQYGCYSEFMAPVLKVIGLSVLKISLLLATLTAASFLAILWTATRLIRSPSVLLAAGLAALVLLNFGFPTSTFEPYFQYVPIRLLFPALSLPLGFWWLGRATPKTSLCLGAFGAVASLWNLDSGSVVLGALGVLVAFVAPTWRARGALVGAFLLGALGATAMVWAIWSIGSGHVAHLEKLFLYPRIYAAAGFMTMPTPPPPSSWAAAIAVAVMAVTGAALARFRGEAAPRAIMLGYLAILGVGLMTYFFSRSAPTNLPVCVWPLALAAFVLLDPAKQDADGLVRRAAAWPCVIVAASAFLAGWPALMPLAKARIHPIFDRTSEPDIRSDLVYLRQATGGQPFDMISMSQAIYHAATYSAATMPGPGLVEIMLEPLAKQDVSYLLENGPPHLFIGAEAFHNHDILPWLTRRISELRKVYVLADWSPTAHIVHFVRKPTSRPDLFDFAPRQIPTLDGRTPDDFFVPLGSGMVAKYGRPVNDPRDWVWNPADQYAVTLTVQPKAGPQADHAAIISTHPNQFAGYVLYAVPGTDPVKWAIGSADGVPGGVGSQPFDLPTDRPSHLVLRYGPTQLLLTVDDRVVADLKPAGGPKFIPSPMPITLGDWIGRTHPFTGVISDAYYYADPVKKPPAP